MVWGLGFRAVLSLIGWPARVPMEIDSNPETNGRLGSEMASNPKT